MRNRGFERFYLFGIRSKGTMGIYLTAFLFFYFIVGWLGGGRQLSVDFARTAEMTAACLLIGYAQAVIVPAEKFSAPRAAAWLALSSAVTVGFTLLFGWFAGFPAWCPVLFCGAVMIGLSGYLLGLLYDARRDTERLSAYLKDYQEKIRKADV